MTSRKASAEDAPGFDVYTDSWNAPSSISYLPDSGVPSRALTTRPLSSGTHAPSNARVRPSRPLTEPVCARNDLSVCSEQGEYDDRDPRAVSHVMPPWSP